MTVEEKHQQNETAWREALANGASNKEIAALEKALAESAIAVKREEVRREINTAQAKEEAEKAAREGIAKVETDILAFNDAFTAVVQKYNAAFMEVAREFAAEITALPNVDRPFSENARHHATLEQLAVLPPEIVSKCINLSGAVGGEGAMAIANVTNFATNIAARARHHAQQQR